MASRERRPKTDPKTDARLRTLEKKSKKLKDELLERLSKAPVITAAIRAVGIGRSTYYKWCKEDPEFDRVAKLAIGESRKLVNDIAISKLMQRIDEGHMTALIFWLKNNHEWFTDIIRHEHTHEHHVVGDGILTPEQHVQVVDAMRRAGRYSAQETHKLLATKFLAELYPDSPELSSRAGGPPIPPPNIPSVSPHPPKSPPKGGKKAVKIADLLK